MPFFVRFWGTRGSIPTPGNPTRRFGGNTACVEIRAGDQTFICDAGSGIRELGADLMTRGLSGSTIHLLLSHTHWDHVQGFPFFAAAHVPGFECFVYGAREGDDGFYKLLSGQVTTNYLPIRFTEMRPNIVSRFLNDGPTEIGGVSVRNIELIHPGGSLGYSLIQNNVKLVYTTDNEIDSWRLDSNPERSADDELRLIRSPLVDFVRDADLLISDGQYTDEEYSQRVGWGHSSCLTAVDLAVQAKVKALAIFHHDPERSDADVDRMIEDCHARVVRLRSDLFVFGAREGVELKLG